MIQLRNKSRYSRPSPLLKAVILLLSFIAVLVQVLVPVSVKAKQATPLPTSPLQIEKITSQQLTPQQQNYLDAREALKNRDLTQFKQLRGKLTDYPLAIYLDFNANIDSLLTQNGPQAEKSLSRFKGSPLFDSARFRYLMAKGDSKQWQDFLHISPTRPRNKVLQCYFYRAKLAVNHDNFAYLGAKRLWLHGRSQPEQCDPLFEQWEQAGLKTQPLIWQRMLLAFDESQLSLLNYLANQLTYNENYARQLVTLYKNPSKLRDINQFANNTAVYGEIAYLGLKRLAQKDLIEAVNLFKKYQSIGRFTSKQRQQLRYWLVKRALLKREVELIPFIDHHLPHLGYDKLIEQRLRWLIAENQLTELNRYIAILSPTKQQNHRWKFWSNLSTNLSETLLTKALSTSNTVASLSEQRNFYGFATAQMLDKQFLLNQQNSQSSVELSVKLTSDQGFLRVQQLRAINRLIDAKAEWILMLSRHNRAMQLEYGLYALRQGWDDLAIETSIYSKAWDDINLRFPQSLFTIFKQAGETHQLSHFELMAITRRESAMYPFATSSVGARGLMQLMPRTAKATAKKHKLHYKGATSLYDPTINIQLGSLYYAQLMKQFNNNRILATAAYNAGPYRVKEWLKESDGKLDMFSFIESIPYKETREYVQAVLSYRVIFQQLQGEKGELYSTEELNFRY